MWSDTMRKYQAGDLNPNEWIVKILDIKKKIRKLEKIKYDSRNYPRARILITELKKWI